MRNSADVVVVGGGIIGCGTAAELAGLGADVMLLERSEIAHGASGRNHGLIFYPQNTVSDPLYRASLQMYREAAETSELNLSLDEQPAGFIVLVGAEPEWEAAEAEADACQIGGIAVERLGRSELRAAEPNLSEELLGGYLVDDGYRVDPQALTLFLALEARRRGAEIVTQTEVKQVLVRDGRTWGVATDQGMVQAEVVVIAAGPWSARLARSAGINLPITGARGWLLLTHAAPRLCNHILGSAGWHLVTGDPRPAQVSLEGYSKGGLPAPADVGMLIQQNVTGHVMLGGSRLVSIRQDSEGPEVTRDIARRAVSALPLLGDLVISETWSGVRPMSPDGLPLIGWAGEPEGLFVVGGHGGQGVILGGGSARLAAQMISGASPYTDPAPFAVDRPASPGGPQTVGQ